MTRTDHQVKVRLPDELRDSLTAAATKNGRSVNSEIIWRLRRSFDLPEASVTLSDDSEMLTLLREIHAAVLTGTEQKEA